MADIDSLIEKMKHGDYHIGHLLLDRLKKWNPNDLGTIDAGTGESETCGSMLKRIVHLARCMQALSLQSGDLLALGGSNHIHLRIPFFAAMVIGLPVVGVDPTFKYDEIKSLFALTKPKIAFCELGNYELYSRVVKELEIETKIVTFYGDDTNITKFMMGVEEKQIHDFEPPIFDTSKVYAWLVSTSGTTGAPKLAAIRHYEAAKQSIELMQLMKVGGEHNKTLCISPTQWLSGNLITLGLILRNWTIVQSSKPNTIDHMIDVINEYKLPVLQSGPSMLSLMLRSDKKIDMTCIKCVVSGGAKIYQEMMVELKKRLNKDAEVIEAYGQTEAVGIIICGENNAPIGSCGRRTPLHIVKLVDPETGTEVTEPKKPGELWVKGICFAEYYNNPEATVKAFAKDGWLKTGDLLYRDANGYFYFVDRMKMLIKYRSYHIVPPELEEIIMGLPGVKEVCVTGIPHETDGQHVVACVVRRPGFNVTAQEIKDLIAERLSESKQLRGGVVFMDELPKTSTTKVARNKVQEYVTTAYRE